jgi:hypothetical protein
MISIEYVCFPVLILCIVAYVLLKTGSIDDNKKDKKKNK